MKTKRMNALLTFAHGSRTASTRRHPCFGCFPHPGRSFLLAGVALLWICAGAGAADSPLQIAPAIEVSPERSRGVSIDPLMVEIEQSLQQMIEALAKESPPLESLSPKATPGTENPAEMPVNANG